MTRENGIPPIDRNFFRSIAKSLLNRLVLPKTLGTANNLLLPRLESPNQQSPIVGVTNAHAFDTYAKYWHEFTDILVSGTPLEATYAGALTDHINVQLRHYTEPPAFLEAFDTHTQNSILRLEDVLTTDLAEPIREGIVETVNEYKTVLTINTLVRRENARPQTI